MLVEFVHMVLLGCSNMGIVAALIKISTQILNHFSKVWETNFFLNYTKMVKVLWYI